MVFELNILRLTSNSQIRLRDFGQQIATGECLNLHVEAQMKRSSDKHRTIAAPELTTGKIGTGMSVIAQRGIQAPDSAALCSMESLARSNRCSERRRDIRKWYDVRTDARRCGRIPGRDI